MRKFNLTISKPIKIILVLLFINIIAFSATHSIAQEYSPLKSSHEENKNMSIIEKGWQIVNWSYNLLKYFKKPNTTDLPG